MASYTFKWEHPDASEVYVTGSFDDWSRSVHLEKKDDHFEKTVQLPADKKILYKFVVDGHWVLDPTKPTETDDRSNSNNVLEPSDIKAPVLATAVMSNVTPNSTTAALAAEVPKEGVPGTFPETPASEHAGFSVNPIPATSGIGNPIKLAPGEKVPDPSTLTSNTIASTVRTDAESYEKSNASVPYATKSTVGDLGVPPLTKNTIPESSLPMGAGTGAFTDPGAFIQSAGAGSTTAALAAAVPKEGGALSGVPQVVTDSINKAHESPEAAANAEAVKEKGEVEAELEKKIHPTDASGEPAPTETASTSATAPGKTNDVPETTTAKKSKRKSIIAKLKKIF